MSGQTYTYEISNNSSFSNGIQTWRLVRVFTDEEIESQNRLIEDIVRALLEGDQ
jgi:hypothetical protein